MESERTASAAAGTGVRAAAFWTRVDTGPLISIVLGSRKPPHGVFKCENERGGVLRMRKRFCAFSEGDVWRPVL
jgi:hypothetical protein